MPRATSDGERVGMLISTNDAIRAELDYRRELLTHPTVKGRPHRLLVALTHLGRRRG